MNIIVDPCTLTGFWVHSLFDVYLLVGIRAKDTIDVYSKSLKVLHCELEKVLKAIENRQKCRLLETFSFWSV